MESTLQQNKSVVIRFNKEVIEEGNLKSFHELMDKDFINRTAPPGMNNGPAGMIHTFNNILRPAFPDIRVTIHEQMAEGDLVTTRKSITGTHTGPLMDIAPTGEAVTIDVIDIVRVRDGKYYEHWGINTLWALIARLSKK